MVWNTPLAGIVVFILGGLALLLLCVCGVGCKYYYEKRKQQNIAGRVPYRDDLRLMVS